jgi:O-antigen ligase
VYLLALIWTEDMAAGWKMVDRQTPLLLLLLYWSSADSCYRERYISAFLAGLIVCAALAYYNWAQLHWLPDWPAGVRVTKDPSDTAPFVDRIMYAPMLALGGYFSMRRAVFSESWRGRLLSGLIAALLIVNLAISGGRAGMVMFGALAVVLVFERVKATGKALLVSAVLLPLAFVSLYASNSYFAQRVDRAVVDIQTFEQNPNSSLGLRIVYWTTSFKLFLNDPILGVGSGDFTKEYARTKPTYWQSTPDTFNPHNQYLMTATTTGLLGLAALLVVFYLAAASGADPRARSVLVGFAVVCMFESYLWRSNTALAFSVIMAVLVTGAKSATVRRSELKAVTVPDATGMTQ